MARLEDKKLFLLDMDGTIYIDEDLFPGTIPFLDAVRERGGRYLFLTNNSSRSVDAYISKLARMGIPSVREDFLTSVDALIADLAGRPPFRKCYAFGTRTFRQQLAEAGVPVTDRLEDDIDCLLMGFDTELVFQKLEDACILLNRGVEYIAANLDWVCPGTGPCRMWGAYVRCCSRPPGGGPGASESRSLPCSGWLWSGPGLPPGRR